jgi:hypothetical protein
MKRIPLLRKWRGPETKRDFTLKAKTTAKLSQECGWQKPLIKQPIKEGKQQ